MSAADDMHIAMHIAMHIPKTCGTSSPHDQHVYYVSPHWYRCPGVPLDVRGLAGRRCPRCGKVRALCNCPPVLTWVPS